MGILRFLRCNRAEATTAVVAKATYVEDMDLTSGSSGAIEALMVDGAGTSDESSFSGPEVFTANLCKFDECMDALERSPRYEEDPKCNMAFWAAIREGLTEATLAGGFDLPRGPNCFSVKSAEDVKTRLSRVGRFSWLCPLSPEDLATRLDLPTSLVLTELLYASAMGMMELLWVPQCQNCGMYRLCCRL